MNITETPAPRRRLVVTDWPVLAIAGLLALLAVLGILYATRAKPGLAAATQEYASFGRGVDDVALSESTGRQVQWGALKGAPRAVFFGFTRCPEICPTTVADLSAAIETLGPAADGLVVDFVSVDPERDTPELMAQYFSSFGPRFRGYTGAKSEIDRLVASFHVFYEHVPDGAGDYTVNHTAIVYLVNSNGEVVDIMGYQTPQDRAVAQLRALINQET